MLSDSILKYLRPEIVEEPSFTGGIRNGTRVELNPGVEGKYVTYQWYKDGEPIDGATSQLFTIDNFDVGYHDGNYTVVASNDFGSVESQPIKLVEGGSMHHTVDLNASVALEMIWVEPGTFTMGSPETEAGRSSLETQHEVTLTQGFYLGKYEVTQAQYEAVMTGNSDGLSATPSNWPNNPDRPVEKVSHDDIQKFLTRLNEQQSGSIPDGWAYVLPTEAQWEYACRAGTTTAYSWGDAITSDDANYDWDGDWNTGSDFKETRDVGQYSANPWGFFDMHGNVWEWTADAWGSYTTGAQTDPFNVGATGANRVRRGGSWDDTGTYLRSATRTLTTPSTRYTSIGFRVGFQQQ
jgi:formylglycine-generating enzyme required for sulfatase activity